MNTVQSALLAFPDLGEAGAGIDGAVVLHAGVGEQAQGGQPQAARLGLGEIVDTAAGAAAGADLVILCVPVGAMAEVAAEIADVPGVSEVYSVTGEVDLIAMIRVRQHDELADVIADRLSKVEGVLRTQTYIAFRTYSSHDLEAAFSLGLEG